MNTGALREELAKIDYWDTAYERLINKEYIPQHDKDVIWFVREVDSDSIAESLISGDYDWSIPEKVLIAKSGTNRKRTVYKYSIQDRLILGVLYRALSNLAYNDISKSCFSYKCGVSTGDAIEYIKSNKLNNDCFGVKVDIHAYFNSVSEARVREMLDELFGTEDIGIRKTMNKIMLDKTVMFRGHKIQEFKSLIPGCALGSLFANYCLSDMDREFEKMGIVYARYSDDIIILDESMEKIDKDLELLKSYLGEYGLEINPDKYKYFKPGDDIDFLGLELDGDGTIDISKHAKQKIKKQIHRWCRKGRMEIERDGKDFNNVAKRIINRLNNKNFKCFIENDTKFGWGVYAFRYINTIRSLSELDFYTRDTLRAMKTGKHNKANVRALTDEDFKELGWVSLVDMYMLYKEDIDYYCEVVELMK